MMGWGYMGTGGLAMVLHGASLCSCSLGRHWSSSSSRRFAATTRRPGPGAELRMTAEDELELRYARGEIDATTLVQRRAALRQP